MNKLLPIIVVMVTAYFGLARDGNLPRNETIGYGARNRNVSLEKTAETGSQSEQVLAIAFENQTSNIQIEGRGIIAWVLPDDVDGSRHQRFIIGLDSGQTLLVTHNIDLAPRITALREGDPINFYGEYEWNPKGGVIHWTHHDPEGRHPAGWIKHNGRTYQ